MRRPRSGAGGLASPEDCAAYLVEWYDAERAAGGEAKGQAFLESIVAEVIRRERRGESAFSAGTIRDFVRDWRRGLL
jgi:hypothetical protein